VGILLNEKPAETKHGEPMEFLTFEDETASMMPPCSLMPIVAMVSSSAMRTFIVSTALWKNPLEPSRLLSRYWSDLQHDDKSRFTLTTAHRHRTPNGHRTDKQRRKDGYVCPVLVAVVKTAATKRLACITAVGDETIRQCLRTDCMLKH
jgi:hypothetical protein